MHSHFDAVLSFLKKIKEDHALMQNTFETSSAVTLDRETIDLVLERSRQIALEQAGEKEEKVADVATLQRNAYKKLLADAQGSDGEALDRTNLISEETTADIDEAIDKDHADRMSSIGAAPDAYVFKRTDATVGLQHDGDRRIGLADEVLDDADLAKRVSAHEAEHRRQETGNSAAALPETGNADLDRKGGIDRLTFRENGAIKAEGGLAGHTEEYHGYVQTSDAVAEYLNANGESGDALVTEAGATNEGFAKLHQAIVSAATRRKVEEQMKQLAV